MKKYSLSALLAAGLLAGAATSASAADLGGNCCADLEERIAELEATTVRKGNRKVSLTISGWVAEQVMWWDDGVESNTYVSGIGTTLASHFKLTGEAKITAGWSAGYTVHVEVNNNDPFFFNQATDEGVFTPGVPEFRTGVVALQSFWYLKSDQLGKVSVGRQSPASDNTAILVDGSGSLVPSNWVLFDQGGFGLRQGGAAVAGRVWGSLGHCHQISGGIGADCTGAPMDVIRYDSPTFAGFSVSATWGEDDFWDVAARYAGEFSGIKLAVAAAYSSNKNENTIVPLGAGLTRDVQYFQIGAYLQHVPTGLFVYGAYGQESVDAGVTPGVGVLNDDPNHWMVKAGIRQKWTPLGHTVLYGEYSQHNDMNNLGLGSELKRYGGGIVQEIDAAAMSLWLSYRHHEGEFSDIGSVDDFDLVKFGALIAF